MSRPRARRLADDDRAVTPAIGKALEAGVVVLFVAAMTGVLYGGVVPRYRTAAGDDLADRVVVGAAEQVEAGVPPNATAVRAVHAVSLPTSIRGANYRIEARNRSLVLVHPHDGVGARARLALPTSVVSVSGSWESGGDPAVLVTDAGGGLAVRLVDRGETGGPGGDRR